jgi:hypothetical protein
VQALIAEGAERVTMKKLIARLSIGRSATYDRAKRALVAGYVFDEAKRDERGWKSRWSAARCASSARTSSLFGCGGRRTVSAMLTTPLVILPPLRRTSSTATFSLGLRGAHDRPRNNRGRRRVGAAWCVA